MAVKVRLQRGGRISLPIYSIVVTDSRSSRDKKFIERLGFWAPKARGQEVPFKLDEERLNYWVGVGAQVTDVVARLMVKNNVGSEKVRAAFAKAKTRRIKTAEVVAAAKAKGEQLKADAEAKKVAAEAAAAKAAEEEAKKAAEAAAAEAAAAEAAPVAEAPAAEEQAQA